MHSSLATFSNDIQLVNWRWGVGSFKFLSLPSLHQLTWREFKQHGMFAIIVPASIAPALVPVILFWASQKAKKLGGENQPRQQSLRHLIYSLI